jgi:hypothetical protein
MLKKLFVSAMATAAVAMAIPAALATSYDLNTEFSGAQAPAGPGPWANLTFTDTGAGQVTVQFTSLLSGSENISGWYFNVADQFVGNLSFGSESKVGTFTDPSISQGLNSFKADGDGMYDILLGFAVGGNASAVFGAGESLSFVITSTVSGLDASAFDQLSLDAGGHGPFFTAAHVQNTTGAGSGGSGWIAPGPGNGTSVPDGGTTVMLLGTALAGLAAVRRFVKS